MAKHSIRYVEVRIKGQNFTFGVTRVQYRDAKGRLSKFTTKKRLKMEVLAEREVVDKKHTKKVLRETIVKKYSTGLKKRKRKITVDSINKRIHARLFKEKRSGVLEYTMDGMTKFTYTYPKKEKGSNENKQPKGSKVPNDKKVPRKIRGTKRHSVRHRNNKR